MTAVIELAPRCDCARCSGPSYETFRSYELEKIRNRWGTAGAEQAFAQLWHKEHERRALEEKKRYSRVCTAMPRRAWQVAQWNFVESPEMARLREASLVDGCIAILAGPVGTGKTVAAARLAIELYDKPMFVSAVTWSKWSRYGEERAAVLRHLDEYGELIIDDLGKEVLDGKGALLADLDELIDAIYSDEHGAVITTNCTLPQFKKRYGARISDRLRECGEWIPFSGPSRRGAK